MNQDEVKSILDKYTDHKEYTVIFSGKASKKVDGLYHPDTKEIIIHNKNFQNENSLIYTALHELAHHIDNMENGIVQRNAHGGQWPTILHELIEKAIENQDFIPIDPEKVSNAVRANNMQTKYLKEFGKVCIQLMDHCMTRDYPFEDIYLRVLKMKKGEVLKAMKVFGLDISEEIGPDMAKKVAQIKNPAEREEAIKSGEVPTNTPSKKEMDEYAYLEAEKKKLVKTISKAESRLAEIELALEGKNDN
ncbi:MAG: hypothetical protein PQJ59_16730 [Spirochaetales bacterium]|nr:hypothetical protein [Spirochaetales bacterium]